MYPEDLLSNVDILAYVDQRREVYSRPSRGSVRTPERVNRMICSDLYAWQRGFMLRKNPANAAVLEEFILAFTKHNSITWQPTRNSVSFNLFMQENPGCFILLREKHGDRYIDASTPDKALKAAMKIVFERLDEGWYWEEIPEDVTPDQLDLFKKPYKSKEDAVREWLEMAKNPTLEYLAGYRIVEFLQERDKNEYEGFEVNWLESF